MVLLMTLAAGSSSASLVDRDEPIVVENPRAIGTDRLAAERIPVGITNDYKPCVARMPDGELLLIGFQAPVGRPLSHEYCFLYRSCDDGRTWSKRQDLEFQGREPFVSVTRNGVLFAPTLVLARARNTDGYDYCCLYRSDDGARTWQETKLPFDESLRSLRKDGQRPDKARIGTSRNVLELRDGTCVFGVASECGASRFWRSTDEGRTWDNSIACTYHGGPDVGAYGGPMHNEAFLYEAPNGDILSIKRVDQELYPPIEGTDVPHGATDQYHRMVLYRSADGGASWSFEEFGSWYGEMYPSVLTLQDGRLLLTFTQRTSVPPNKPPLGLRAAIGEQTPDGFRFDFKHDRIVLSARTPANLTSGGGFGPTVQLDGGTLVSSYSYRTADDQLHCEVVRWKLPATR